MSDLIDRQAVDKIINDLLENNNLQASPSVWHGLHMIKQLPSAQRTGRWIWDDEGYHCTECFYHAYGNTSEVMLGDFKFCPNCGCAMEGEEE